MPDPYDEGQDAFFRGDEEDTNPYDCTDAQYKQWSQGWNDAAFEDEFER